VRKVEFIAHRGSSYLAPENTLAAFRLGWQETTTCELDVRASADGQLVVLHDETALRTTGIDLVSERAMLAELQSLDAGAWKGARWRGERIPSLAEVLAIMPPDRRLLIEMKGAPKLVPELARVVRASGREADVALQGFDLATCIAAKAALPERPVYLLAWLGRNRREAPAALSRTLAAVRAEKLDGLGINAAPILSTRVVEQIHAANLTLNIWTIDDIARARRLQRLGIDGLITNRPGWLRARRL
jgi:glycerophosphoryl diester phosphodiesterase